MTERTDDDNHKPDLCDTSQASASKPERTDPRTLELLVCPVSKTALEYDEARQELNSRRANLAYPIRSGVPLLTRDAAHSLDE